MVFILSKYLNCNLGKLFKLDMISNELNQFCIILNVSVEDTPAKLEIILFISFLNNCKFFSSLLFFNRFKVLLMNVNTLFDIFLFSFKNTLIH